MRFDGERLRDEIARRQQSVPEFARDAQLSKFAVYRALTSSRANTKTLGKLAHALGYEKPSKLLRGGNGNV